MTEQFTTDAKSSKGDNLSDARRKFIAGCGKFAVVTPPAVALCSPRPRGTMLSPLLEVPRRNRETTASAMAEMMVYLGIQANRM